MKIERTFPETRMRRIRKNSGLREMLAETNLSRTDLIQPIFIKEDLSGTEEIKTMPGINRIGLDILNDEFGIFNCSIMSFFQSFPNTSQAKISTCSKSLSTSSPYHL